MGLIDYHTKRVSLTITQKKILLAGKLTDASISSVESVLDYACEVSRPLYVTDMIS